MVNGVIRRTWLMRSHSSLGKKVRSRKIRNVCPRHFYIFVVEIQFPIANREKMVQVQRFNRKNKIRHWQTKQDERGEKKRKREEIGFFFPSLPFYSSLNYNSLWDKCGFHVTIQRSWSKWKRKINFVSETCWFGNKKRNCRKNTEIEGNKHNFKSFSI